MELVRVGVFNSWRENKHIESDLKKIGPEVDVLLLMEAGYHHDEIRAFCRENPQWAAALPIGSFNEKQNVIMYRETVFEARERTPGVLEMCEGTAGTPPRFLTTKRLIHKKTGMPFKARVTHANSHIEQVNWRALPRYNQYRRHIKKLVRLMKKHPGEGVQVCGIDTNANYARRTVRFAPTLPYLRMARAGIKSNYSMLGLPNAGTKGSRFIDALFATGAKFVRHRVITGLGADHNCLVVVVGF